MRRAPIQKQRIPDTREEKPAGSISWEEHELAWIGYKREYPGSARDQDAECIARRGGFGHIEAEFYLGRALETFTNERVIW